MPNDITGYYKDELADWKRLIEFYDEELVELQQRLGEVVQRNTITGIGAKTEAQQDKLNNAAESLYTLLALIEKQQKTLTTNSHVIDNTALNGQTGDKQDAIRSGMQLAEKNYIDAKYSCLNFLADTLMKRAN